MEEHSKHFHPHPSLDADKLPKRFPGQKEGEQIQVLVRKHWIVDIKIAAIFVVLGFIPLSIYITVIILFWTSQPGPGQLLTALLFLVYFLFSLLFTYVKWLNEELDVIIVTNERAIGHDQINFFHKQISETDLSQIQDVKGVEKGFLGTVLHYGSLEIQTAADQIAFRIDSVPRPYDLARHILDIRDAHLDREKFEHPKDGEHH